MRKPLILIVALLIALVGCEDTDRIETLEEENARLESELDELRSGISSAKVEMASLESEISDLESEVAAIQPGCTGLIRSWPLRGQPQAACKGIGRN
jgi:septal ring factor EnvC (AmiA/AmiB activator)